MWKTMWKMWKTFKVKWIKGECRHMCMFCRYEQICRMKKAFKKG